MTFQRLVSRDNGSGDRSAGSVRLRMLDSSTVPVHRHGAGAPRDGESPQIGECRDGRTTKVHLSLDENATARIVFRRFATRYDKTARSFLSAVSLVISRFLLRRIARQSVESTAQAALMPCFIRP